MIGIDLGTTNSLAAHFKEGTPQLIPNALGEWLTPSVVGVLESGEVLVGSAARELRVTQPERCASCFKRLMGTSDPITLSGREFTPVELSSLVLGSLKEDASAFLGREVTEAVITVPAYFNDAQRKATKQAGELAGLKVRRVLNEPTAAALTYGFHDRQGEKKLVVLDLGGGTFDVTLMEVFEGTLEILSTAGESMLGGEDFTDRLVSLILRQQGESLEVAELKTPLRVARLRQQCELAKRELTESNDAHVRLPDDQGDLPAEGNRVRIDRATFAKGVKTLLERIEGPILRALRDGECRTSEIDEVILVGGATRMHVIREQAEQLFSLEPRIEHDPDHVVALGAAVQAALITDDRAVDDMVMTDVCPFTLGVNTVREMGGQHKEGYFSPIIHRNTTIPVSKEESFSTVSPNQREVRLEVYQGEHRRVEKNQKLGELVLNDLPPGPAGQEILVRFTYDLNGILEVEAYLPGGGHRCRTVLTNHAGELTEAEIAEATRKMQSLKYYPREDLANQRLLRMAERVVGEISPYQRDEFERIVTFFESTLYSSDKEQVEIAREQLEMALSALGYTVPRGGEAEPIGPDDADSTDGPENNPSDDELGDENA